MSGSEPPPSLPVKAADTTAEQPWPVRHLSGRIAEYIARMPSVWVEGQVVQLNRRAGLTFLTLRDTDVDMSLPVSLPTSVLDRATTPVQDGAHVVVRATPTFWSKRGTLQMSAEEIRPVGVGELLARIEHLKRVLAAEGLFDEDRKVPLPFLPAVVGLICGRESKAEQDVVVNARARWPQVQFVIREVAVQGVSAVPQVSEAIVALDADERVEVIVVARGGGAVEDLLPFSNETLLRAAAACVTPLVSAIGHETDTPLLDLVADWRASTPTDAAKRIVPDVAAERQGLALATRRMSDALARMLRTEQDRLDSLRARPVLAEPGAALTVHADLLHRLVLDGRRSVDERWRAAGAEQHGLVGRLRALSPGATLDRGYAIVQTTEGAVVRSPEDVDPGDLLDVRLRGGSIGVVVGPRADPAPSTVAGLVG